MPKSEEIQRRHDVAVEMNVMQQTQSDEEEFDEEKEEDMSPLLKNTHTRRLSDEPSESDCEPEDSSSDDDDEKEEKDIGTKSKNRVISPNVGAARAAPGTAAGTPLINHHGHEFAPIGFQNPASAGHIMIIHRGLSRRHEANEAPNAQLHQQINERDNKIKRLQRREIVGTIRKKCPFKDMPDKIKEHVLSMKKIMKDVIVRNLKFQESGWDNGKDSV